MKDRRLIKISRYLSYHLRHNPEKLGLKLGRGGWVVIDELLEACRKQKFFINFRELKEVVENDEKKRFSFDVCQIKIRANQGHSIPVDLELEVMIPPDVLYHGTSQKAVASILKKGLCKMERHHVHLSTDTATARDVGRRHGKPVVFVVNAASMNQMGYEFFRSDNGVWLVDFVPPEYLTLL